MKHIVAVPSVGRTTARPLRNACDPLSRDRQPDPPRAGGPRPKPRILILGTADDSRRIISALRRAGHCPLWKRVETGGSLTAALSDPSWTWNVVICNCALPSCHFLSARPIVEALVPRAALIALCDRAAAPPAADHDAGTRTFIAGHGVRDLPDLVSRIMARRYERADSNGRPLHSDRHRPHYN